MKKTAYYISAIAGIVLLLGTASTTVRAQSSIPLQVSPPRQEIVLDPGESSAVNIRFYNLGDAPLTGILKAADFIVEDDQGTPRIIDNPAQASPRFSGSQWFTLPYDRMSIAPNDAVTIQARIAVPQDARPGGRYVAVYFEPTAGIGQSVDTTSAQIAPRIAGLVYVKVNGPITEKALVSRLFAPTFQEYGPVSIEADILNRGDYHIRPQGSITLQNMMGGLVDQQNLDEVNIFPDAQRSYETELGHKWMIGKYTVTVLATYGTSGQVVQRTIGVWVFPWKATLVVILALAILFYLVRFGYRNIILKENKLSEQLKREHEEVEKLKDELHKRG